MTAAVVAGSFDPITTGHLDLIERSAKVFDTVYVTAFHNAEKKGMFTAEEKLSMLKLATSHLPNVVCSVETGLLSDFAKEHHAVLIKGVRNGTDFDYEMGLAGISRAMNPEVDTFLLPAKQEYLHISSSYVREMLRYRREFRGAVPEPVYRYLQTEWKKEKN